MSLGVVLLLLTASGVGVYGAPRCPAKFTSEQCRSYADGDAALMALHEVCSAVPFATGCSVHRSCGGGTVDSDVCFPLNYLVAICDEFPDLDACADLREACGDVGRLVNCEGVVHVQLPATGEMYEAARNVCEMHPVAACDHCSDTNADPLVRNDRRRFGNACTDPFGTLSMLCKEMDMTPCTAWKEWCGLETTAQLPGLCTNEQRSVQAPASHASHGHGHDHSHGSHSNMDGMGGMGGMGGDSGAQLQGADDCVQDPTMDMCEGYTYPGDSVQEDVLSLCVTDGTAMPWMVGCSIWNECKDMDSDEGVCTPFTILATLCADMPGMAGCVRYNSMCGEDSVVPQCTAHGPIAMAPKTMPTQRAIVSACSSHSMPACSECPGVDAQCPHTLETMSKLCFSMPSMAFCTGHSRFCSATNGMFDQFCDASSANYLPPMRMYFHTGQRDIILFRDWIPESTVGYVASFFAVLILGILLQSTKALRMTIENIWLKKLLEARKQPGLDNDDAGSRASVPFLSPPVRLPQIQRNLCRALLTGLTATGDFFLMLIAMTFNVGLFIAVVLGIALGTLFFGHVSESAIYTTRDGTTVAATRQPVLEGDCACCD